MALSPLLTSVTLGQIPGVIGIKFAFTGGYATSDDLAPTDQAGVVAVTNWNNILADVNNADGNCARASAMDVTWNIAQDSAGNALSGVTLTAAGFDDGWYQGGTECANGRLLYDFWKVNSSSYFNGCPTLQDGNGKYYGTLTVSNLSASTYDVYVYVNDNNNNYWGNIEANSVIAAGNNPDSDGINGAEADPCPDNFTTASTYNSAANYVELQNVPVINGVITVTVVEQGGEFATPALELVPVSDVVVSQPIFSPYSVVLPGTSTPTIAGAAVSGSGPYYFQWQTDGGSGGSLTNIPGATSSNLVISTTGFALGDYQYAVNVSNNNSSATSQAAVLTVQEPNGIPGVIGIKFSFTNGYAPAVAPFPADNAGVATGQLVAPSYEPLTAIGGWDVLYANATNDAPGTIVGAAIDQTWTIPKDSAGNALSGVTLTPAGFDLGGDIGGTECGDGRLLYDYWAFDTSGGVGYFYNEADYIWSDVTLTVSNLPASTYDVYLYINDNNGNYWGNVQANGVFASGNDLGDYGFNGADSDPCAANPPLHTATGFGSPVNYVKMPYVSTSGGVITVTVAMDDRAGNFGVSGLELVPSPDITLVQDVLPYYVETVVGDQVVFQAAFSNSPTVNLQWLQISGSVTNNINTGVVNVTNSGVVTSTLTLNNVQVASSGSYQLKAINAADSSDYALSSAAPLEVGGNTAPVTGASLNGITVNYAAQVTGSAYYPINWSVNTGADLIYGFPDGFGPETVDAGTGSFAGLTGDDANGDAAIMDDGMLGDTKATLDACGTDGAGTSVIYSLNTNAAPQGYELTNIQVYGGWTDAGRRDQEYQVLYATEADPTNFVPLLSTHYLPQDAAGAEIATRTTVVPPSGGVLAHNVVAVEINWNITPQYLNGYAGYSQIVIGGTNSTHVVLVPASISAQKVNGNLILTGSSGYPPEPGAAYNLLSTTNLTPPIQWVTNTTGTLDVTGSFSNSIPINSSEPVNFFELQTY